MSDAVNAKASSQDTRFMARAIELAHQGLYSTPPNPRVGCVLVKGHEIVGEGFHYRAGEPHAEVNALRQAGDAARDSTAYVTLEPCCHTGRTPPCTQALIHAGIARVVYAADDPNPKVAGRGAAELRQAGIDVMSDCLRRDAQALNSGFNKRMADGTPYIRVKVAMTMDGKIALASGESQWITGSSARADVQRMRALSGAIVTGVGTVVADDPSLTVRDPRFDTGGRQPLRVIFDSQWRSPLDAKIFREPGQTTVIGCRENEQKTRALEDAGAHVETLESRGDHVDILSAVRYLASCEINDVMVEAGPQLVSAFLAAGAVDELVIYMAPKIMGTPASDAFIFQAPPTLAEVAGFEIKDVRHVGTDLRLRLVPAAST